MQRRRKAQSAKPISDGKITQENPSPAQQPRRKRRWKGAWLEISVWSGTYTIYYGAASFIFHFLFYFFSALARLISLLRGGYRSSITDCKRLLALSLPPSPPPAPPPPPPPPVHYPVDAAKQPFVLHAMRRCAAGERSSEVQVQGIRELHLQANFQGSDGICWINSRTRLIYFVLQSA